MFLELNEGERHMDEWFGGEDGARYFLEDVKKSYKREQENYLVQGIDENDEHRLCANELI